MTLRTRVAVDQGLTRAFHLAGGSTAWQDSGMPVIP